VETRLAAQGRSLLVIEPDEMKDDILRNLHEVIMSLCSRL
jgi:predicted site-specific integrase-resolvase